MVPQLGEQEYLVMVVVRGAGIFPTSNPFPHKGFSPQAPPSPQSPLSPSTATSWVEKATGEGKEKNGAQILAAALQDCAPRREVQS